MKPSTWYECIECEDALKVSSDPSKAKSLIETADGRMVYIEGQSITDKTANYIFEGYYSSVMEILHSLVLFKGFKVGNHICLGFYLRDVLKKEDIFRLFDDCRFKRNSLVYFGKQMDFETAKEAIQKSIKLIKCLKELIK